MSARWCWRSARGTLTVAGQMGVLAGAYARTLDHVYSLETLMVLPLGFLGGIFYSVAQLPPVWRALSEVNPVFYIVQTLRIGFLGSGDIPAGVALGVLWSFAVALSAGRCSSFAPAVDSSNKGRRMTDAVGRPIREDVKVRVGKS